MFKKITIFLALCLIIFSSFLGFSVVRAVNTKFVSSPTIDTGQAINFLPSGSITGSSYSGNALTASTATNAGDSDKVDGIHALWSGVTTDNIWNLNSGNVGIGTSAPLEKLEVNKGSAYINDNTAINWGVNDRTNSPYLYFGGQYWNNLLGSKEIKGGLELLVSTTNNTSPISRLGFFPQTVPASSGEIMSILSSGNVGIGKTNPATALDVNGTVTATQFVGGGANLTGVTAATATYAAASSKLYSTDVEYAYGSASPYYGYLTYQNPYWRFQVSPATPASVKVAAADLADYATGATTATYLSANGANCSAGYYSLGVDASGVAEGCTAVPADTDTDIYWTGTATNLVAATGRASLGLGSLATQSTVTDAQVPDNITISYAAAALSATYLAANGTNCSAGYYPLGVDNYGTVESCTAAPVDTDIYWTGTATNLVAATGRTSLNVPTRTGGDASGTWGINITGSAGSATDSTKVAKAGDTMTGNLIISTGTGGTNLTLNAYSGATTGITLATAGSAPGYGVATVFNGTSPTITLNGNTGDVSATSFSGNLSGNASTASALANNGTNCSAGYYPLGVSANGSVESCTAAPVDTDTDIYWNGSATGLNAADGRTSLGLGSLAIESSVTFGMWNTPCTYYQIPKYLPGTGWTCSADVDTDTNSGGTVTTISQGTGLSFSSNPIITTGTITLNINAGATQTCSGTQKVSAISSTGITTCTSDVDTDTNSGGTVTSLSATAPITLSPSTITTSGTIAITANSKWVDGYVTGPGAVASYVWKTDVNGNPGWLADADTNAYNTSITGTTGSFSGTLTTQAINAGTNKITAGTFDPVYTINDKHYATYLPGMTGVKEETAAVLTLSCIKNNCSQVIDFNNLPVASDLWLFARTTNLTENFAQMSVLLSTGFNGSVWYEKNEAQKTLTIKARAAASAVKTVEVSYRLTAPRFDFAAWPNISHDNIEGFNLDKLLRNN